MNVQTVPKTAETRVKGQLPNGMEYRDYQETCASVLARAVLNFPKRPRYGVKPTGSGKSFTIANIAHRLGGALVLQPSQEILRQNYAKARLIRPEEDVGMFSASVGRRQMRPITYATIGSIKKFPERFKGKYPVIVIDECHVVNPRHGRSYTKFCHEADIPVVGLTATAVRLRSDGHNNGSRLEMLHRIQPDPFFKAMSFVAQIGTLHKRGYLADFETEKWGAFDRRLLEVNPYGSDYTPASMRVAASRVRMSNQMAEAAVEAMKRGCKHILGFAPSVADAEDATLALNQMADGKVAGVIHGGMSNSARAQVLSDFLNGTLQALFNCEVLTTGFDFPALDCVILGRATLSLSLYYQMVGRLLRPFPGFLKLLIDLVGDTDRYGNVLKLRYEQGWFPDEDGFTSNGWAIVGEHGNPLTGIKLEAI